MRWEANKTRLNEKVYSEQADQSSAGARGLVPINQRARRDCLTRGPGELWLGVRLTGPLRSARLYHLYLFGSNRFLLPSRSYTYTAAHNVELVKIQSCQAELRPPFYKTRYPIPEC